MAEESVGVAGLGQQEVMCGRVRDGLCQAIRDVWGGCAQGQSKQRIKGAGGEVAKARSNRGEKEKKMRERERLEQKRKMRKKEEEAERADGGREEGGEASRPRRERAEMEEDEVRRERERSNAGSARSRPSSVRHGEARLDESSEQEALDADAARQHATRVEAKQKPSAADGEEVKHDGGKRGRSEAEERVGGDGTAVADDSKEEHGSKARPEVTSSSEARPRRKRAAKQ